MIRARADDQDGRPLILLGLSRENVRRLMADQPIKVTGESVGRPDVGSILIFFGETEEVMYERLKAAGMLPSPDKIHRDPRTHAEEHGGGPR